MKSFLLFLRNSMTIRGRNRYNNAIITCFLAQLYKVVEQVGEILKQRVLES